MQKSKQSTVKPKVKTKVIPAYSGMPSKMVPAKNPTFVAPAGRPHKGTRAVSFGTTPGFQMPPEPAKLSSQIPPTPQAAIHPLVPMSPGMLSSIRKSPTGKIPPGLSKWMAAHGKGVK